MLSILDSRRAQCPAVWLHVPGLLVAAGEAGPEAERLDRAAWLGQPPGLAPAPACLTATHGAIVPGGKTMFAQKIVWTIQNDIIPVSGGI